MLRTIVAKRLKSGVYSTVDPHMTAQMSVIMAHIKFALLQTIRVHLQDGLLHVDAFYLQYGKDC